MSAAIAHPQPGRDPVQAETSQQRLPTEVPVRQTRRGQVSNANAANTLSPLATAEAAKAQPAAAFLKSIVPSLNEGVWNRMSDHDPQGMQCLSRMVENGFSCDTYKNATDPRLKAEYHNALFATLGRMEREFQSGDTSFCNHVANTARENVGRNDAAAFAHLSIQYDASKLGFVAERNLHMPQDTGVCHRESTKWAACQAVGVPFKYEGMNVEKIEKKHKAFVESHGAAIASVADPTMQGLSRAARQASNHAIQDWTAKFTDANGVAHRGEIDVSLTQRSSPSRALSQRPLGEGESMMVTLEVFMKDGSAKAHTLAITGGDTPKLFDPGFQTEFQFKGRDFGVAVEQYVRQVWADADPENRVNYSVTTLTAKAPHPMHGTRP